MKVTLPNGMVVEGTTAELAPLLGIEGGSVKPAAPKAKTPAPAAANNRLATSVTPKQFDVIEALRELGGTTAYDIALHLDVTQRAVWGLLNTLKHKGIVQNDEAGWQLTKLASGTAFEPTRSHGYFGELHDGDEEEDVDVVELEAPAPVGTVKVLSVVLYDTIQTMLDYGEPIKAAGIGTLMGLPTQTISGRLDALKARGLVEQYPNHTTWRVVPDAQTYTYYPEGME